MEQQPSKLASAAPLYKQPLRWLAVTSVASYYRIGYRTRGWGALPRKRGSTLVVANHQNQIESPVVVSDLTIRSFSWRWPIFTVSSRRMWEPGFIAGRIKWLAALMRNAKIGPLIEAIGLQPIENELHARPFFSVADLLRRRYGNAPLVDVFRPKVLERLPAEMNMLSDIFKFEYLEIGQTNVKLSDLNEPYKTEALRATREEFEADNLHFEELEKAGATIFLTPEGFYSGDGKMQRLRGLYGRLLPLGKLIVIGISYDPFVGRRLSMCYRVMPSVDGNPLDVQLKARRPVTTSALLATWLASTTHPFRENDAIEAVKQQLAELPAILFVEPELRRDPEGLTRKALVGLQRLGTLRPDGDRFILTSRRMHPKFPHSDDIVAYQRNFHEETLDGARRFESAMLESDAQYARS